MNTHFFKFNLTIFIIQLRFADLIIIYTDLFSAETSGKLAQQIPTFSSDFRSVNGIIDAFVNMGAQRSQISLIVEPIGISFKRVDCQSEVEPGCPANDLGSIIYSENTLNVEGNNGYPFILDLPTVCRVLADPEWTKKYDSVAQVPYAYNSGQWMGYDNEQSIKAKVNI